MNNDLISRSALKKAIAEATYNFEQIPIRVDEVQEIIDNAPTVDTDLSEYSDKLWKEAYERGQNERPQGEQIAWEQGYECGKNEKRPQGEWIYGEDDCGQDGWFCSECGFFVPWYYQFYENDIDFIRDYKVCPHCEAKMITYTGKDRDMKEADNDSKRTY